MDMIAIHEIKYGDFLEQNLYRHDGLLALSKGTSIRDVEKECIQDMQMHYVYVAPYYQRTFPNEETLEIIEDVVYSCSLWDMSSSKKLYTGLEKKLQRNPKVLSVLSLMREVDHYSFVSSINTAMVVAQLLMVDNRIDRHLIEIVFYTLIHDIGKVKVAKITQKQGELSESEFKKVQEHPQFSRDLLEKYGFSKNDVNFVMQTHERYDGSGYPLHIKGYEIQPISQVISIAETYNALSSFRPHRPPFHPIEVSKMIEDEKNKAFAEDYVALFTEKFNPYQEGARIELTNGMSGEILQVNPQIPLFPLIGVYNENTGEIYTKINLYRYRDVRIARVLPKERL
ncbi:HD-GYP domain-containing protein [Priestia aryabhattai]